MITVSGDADSNATENIIGKMLSFRNYSNSSAMFFVKCKKHVYPKKSVQIKKNHFVVRGVCLCIEFEVQVFNCLLLQHCFTFGY